MLLSLMVQLLLLSMRLLLNSCNSIDTIADTAAAVDTTAVVEVAVIVGE